MDKYVLAFLKCKGVGNVKLLNFIKKYNFNGEQILNNKNEILNSDDLGIFDKYVDMSEKEIDNQKKLGIKIISVLSKNYPVKLLNIKDPILYLFFKGNIKLLYNTSIAVIGSRDILDNEKKLITNLSKYISSNDVTVVSGLALGSDTCAHVGSIKESGHTIAILPSSIDIITPSSNKKLAYEILDNDGLLLSEYPLNTPPTKYTYVKRDRIQAAISDAVVIVKASETSGTMHAVKIAQESNKYVAQYIKNSNNFIFNSFKNKEDVNAIINIARNVKYENLYNHVYEQESLF